MNNIIDVIQSLLNKDSLDINSLTIMLCCNLLRKIKTSKYINYEKNIITIMKTTL